MDGIEFAPVPCVAYGFIALLDGAPDAYGFVPNVPGPDAAYGFDEAPGADAAYGFDDDPTPDAYGLAPAPPTPAPDAEPPGPENVPEVGLDPGAEDGPDPGADDGPDPGEDDGLLETPPPYYGVPPTLIPDGPPAPNPAPWPDCPEGEEPLLPDPEGPPAFYKPP